MKTDKRWRKVQPSTGVFYTRWINGYKCRVENTWSSYDDDGKSWAYIIYGAKDEWWHDGYVSRNAAKAACYRKALKQGISA